MSNLRQIVQHVTHYRGSVILSQRCNMLCNSGFMDDVYTVAATPLQRRAQANAPAAWY